MRVKPYLLFPIIILETTIMVLAVARAY